MKKLFLFMMTALLVFGLLFLAACSPEEKPGESTSESESESASESAYSSESESESERESESESTTPTRVSYKVTFVDESGAPVVGEVEVQMCGGPADACVPIFDADGDGVYTPGRPMAVADNYYVQLNKLPDGYAALDTYEAVASGNTTVYKVYVENTDTVFEFTVVLKAQ